MDGKFGSAHHRVLCDTKEASFNAIMMSASVISRLN